jgi:hypothetical protein
MAVWATAATSLFSLSGLAGESLAAGRPVAAVVAAEARSVAVEFFRSQNERRYDDTCRILSRGFIASHGLRDRRTCAAVMRVEFVWNLRIDFRIGTITNEGDRVVVRAVVDGTRGRLVLVRENGSLRILAVQGG